MDEEILLEAYRANIRKLIYPSLRTLQRKDEAKIQELIHSVIRGDYHDEFPVISVLNSNCLSAMHFRNGLTFRLIDENLVNDINNCNTITRDSLKKIIVQEINFMVRNSITKMQNDDEFNELISKRDFNNGRAAEFWDTVSYDFIDLNRNLQEGSNYNDLKVVLRMIEGIETKVRPNQANYTRDNLKFDSTSRMFMRDRRYRKYYLCKFLCELDYSAKITPKIDGDIILKFLFDNGLSNELLQKYKIHPTELSSMIHLKLLQNNLIQDEFEFQSVMQQNDLKENARKEHLARAIDKINHLVASKMLLVGHTGLNIEREYTTREDAKNALKEFVNRSGIDDLNKFLVDLWLIEIHKIYDHAKIEEIRNAFINENSIKIGNQEYSYKNFDSQKHFLESKVVQNLRKDTLAKRFIKEITEDKDRSRLLNKFLLNNKAYFASYGSNMYFYEQGSVQLTASKLFKKLKLYKNLGSFPCHKIVIDAFKNHMIAVHIRYTSKSASYDGIGHFGGFANEIKRLKFKENNNFVSRSSEETVQYLNKVLKENLFTNLQLSYDGSNVTVEGKEMFLKYLEEFNDIVHQKDKIFLITNEDTIKKRTARIAANKKFNNLCNDDEKDLLKKILIKETSILVEEYSTENNGTIAKSGTNGLFYPEKFRYDISTVFGLELPSEDFKLLEKRENNNRDLKEVTTVETLSLFELIQRFGYFGEAGNIISLISEQDDYKCYAYKYPHEYFAGVIKTITKIVDEVMKQYRREFNVEEEESKRVQLWILGHLVAAAQNEILDGKHAKLIKQNSEMNGNIRRFFITKKPAKHIINFKKYIHENFGKSKSDDLDEEQIAFMQCFFGDSISSSDFNKIQLIASRVHLAITIKNLENTFLDSGKLCLAQFSNNEYPLFNDNNLTVYKSLAYETENEAGLSLSYLVRTYGDTYPIKRIIEMVIGEAPIIFSGTTYVLPTYFKNRLNILIKAVTLNKATGNDSFKIKIECKAEIKPVLLEQFEKNEIETAANDNSVIIYHKVCFSDNFLKDVLNAFAEQYTSTACQGEIDIKENFIQGFLDMMFDSIPDRIKIESAKNIFINI